MEQIIEKLEKLEKTSMWNDWTIDEKKKILEMYLIFCKKERAIFKLIYQYHGCDSYEDIFRDYDKQYLKDKKKGVLLALDEMKYYNR